MITAAPCTLCRTTAGSMQANRHRPARVDTTRLGVPGVCCYGCYTTVLYRVRHGLDPIEGRIKRKTCS